MWGGAAIRVLPVNWMGIVSSFYNDSSALRVETPTASGQSGLSVDLITDIEGIRGLVPDSGEILSRALQNASIIFRLTNGARLGLNASALEARETTSRRCAFLR